MDEHAQWSDDAAAYALGALDSDEATRFEDHVKSCPECRTQLSEMRSAAGALALAAPRVDAPKRLRTVVLADVRRDARSRTERRRAPRWFPIGRPVPVLSGAGALLAAAVIAIAVISGGGSGVRTYPGHVTFANASARLRVGAGTPELIVHRMPAPPAGKVYEVWVLHSRGAVATSALFDVNATGSATIAVPASLRGASGVAVTAEPAGGSRHPTSPGVIDINL